MPNRRVPHFPGLYREQRQKRFRIVITREGKITQRYFYFTDRDSEADAFERAKRIWTELRASMPLVTRHLNAQIERRKSPSGIVGVRRVTTPTKGHDYDYWVAVYTDSRGQRRTKSFSVNLYGEADAKKRAIEARKDGLAQLQ